MIGFPCCVRTFMLCSLCIVWMPPLLPAEPIGGLEKIGGYRYVYRMLFKVYDVELHALQPSGAKALLSGEHPFELRFYYHRRIERSAFIRVANRLLNKNLTSSELESIAASVEALHAAYRSVKKGDRSVLRYIPGNGTTLSINDHERVTLTDPDARLYFKIWIGAQPISKTMREALLGRRPPS